MVLRSCHFTGFLPGYTDSIQTMRLSSLWFTVPISVGTETKNSK